MRALFAKGAHESSVLRRLDARTKLGITALTAVLAVCTGGVVAQGVLFVVTLGYALLLRRPALLACLYALMAVMLLAALGCTALLSQFMPALSGFSVKALVIPLLRGASMMNVVMALALTTRVEDLLSTLEHLRLPYAVFLPAAVMLRFIPTFADDIRQVWETLRIRGWPMGPKMLTRHPLLSARLLLIPVLFRALKSSESLGIAAELKGLGTAERTVPASFRTLTSLDARILAGAATTTLCVTLAEVLLHDLFMAGAVVMMP